MKKILVIICFAALFLTSCMRNDFAALSKYRLACKSNDEASCAKYLFLETWIDIKRDTFPNNFDKQDWNYWKKRYMNKLQNREDAYVAINTMIASLDDPYTRFLTPKELDEQNMNINSQLSGIGVIMSSKNGKITIEEVLPTSPAKKNDIHPNDIILKANGKSISGFDIEKVASIIRGKKGTVVNLTILRNGKIIEKKLVRDNIKLKSVSSRMLKDNIAYIRIATFMSKNTMNEFLEELKNTNNSKGLILDLRGNPGGLLQNSTAIANIFLSQGTIVSIHQKNNVNEVIKVSANSNQITKPMIVIIDEMSASAAEILAAALQENNRAVLVGKKTYGKGLIQKILPLPMHTAVNVTIARYHTPKGRDINKNGIKPDYEIDFSDIDFKAGKDTQLEKAISLLDNNTEN